MQQADKKTEAVNRTLPIILAGGRGSRLYNLTDKKAKPAVPFGGNFRIIDFALSNAVNSGFKNIYVLTQYQSASLEEYIDNGWNFLRHHGGAVRTLPARPEMNNGEGYLGTADAIYQNLKLLENHPSDWVLVLAGDHVYKMDYGAMLEEHIATGADLTIPCLEVPRMEATGFGVMHVDSDNRIIDFLEKPANPPGMPDNPDAALASMGIYIFNKQFLVEQLRRDANDKKSSHDFGKDLVPYLVPRAKVYAHRFADSCVSNDKEEKNYWRDVGTVDAYWEAHMDLIKGKPAIDLNDAQWPILSPNRAKGRPAADISAATDGDVQESLISPGVHVAHDCRISEAVLLPGVRVGRRAKISKAIIDNGCEIPDGLIVGEDAEEDAKRFFRTSNGIVLINQEMLSALQ
ncbi:MAG TPA: glucose-1-phosphate adenylyltransferase [Patescibacteria group bacterium]|nr:glucose-1-phosphate adenylyltransferase [Patescibacteria group bacterium]